MLSVESPPLLETAVTIWRHPVHTTKQSLKSKQQNEEELNKPIDSC